MASLSNGCLPLANTLSTESTPLIKSRMESEDEDHRLVSSGTSFTSVQAFEQDDERSAVNATSNWTQWPRILCRDALLTPLNVRNYFVRLSSAFGWRFVAIVVSVYGLNQGAGETFYGTGMLYFFTDKSPKGLDLKPDRAQSIEGFANVPWQIKSLYGILSDTFPIFDLHRTPYIFISGIIGTGAWSLLALWPLMTAGIVGILLFFGNLSVAMPDVMIDASVAERCKTHPKLAADLQTLCWASFGVGKIFAAASAGWLYEQPWCGSRGLFAITTLTAFGMLLPAWLGWLGEVPASAGRKQVRSQDNTSMVDQGQVLGVIQGGQHCGCNWAEARERMSRALGDPIAGPLYRLSVFVMCVSIAMGLVAQSSTNDLVIFFSAVLSAVCTSLAVFRQERQIEMRLAKASVYIFLSGAIQPNSMVSTYWVRENEENCKPERNRPCFSPEFLSSLSVVGYVVFVLATSMYNKYFSSWTYTSLWTSTQVMLAAIGMLDFVFVMRWNLALGISDKAFAIGDEVVADLVYRINSMPLFILAAATCPDGVEATLFAMNMGLSNFGKTLGQYAGVGLLWVLGGVAQPEFVNLPLYVLIRSACRLLPLLLIPYLVPDGTPMDEMSHADGAVDTDNGYTDDGYESDHNREEMSNREAFARGNRDRDLSYT